MPRFPLILLLGGLLALGRAGAETAPQAGPATPMAEFSTAWDWELTITRPATGRDCAGDLEATRAMLERNCAGLSCRAGGSEIAEVNQLAGKRSGRLSRANYDLVLRCLAYKDQSKGTVDLLAGPLRRLWRLQDPPLVPAKDEALRANPDRPDDGGCALSCVNHPTTRLLAEAWPTTARLDSALALAHDGGTYFVDLGVLLRTPGMELDLDPLLDGVLVDRAADSLRAQGQLGLRLHIGGVWRDDGIGDPWELPLKHPATHEELGTLKLSAKALAMTDLATPALTLDGRPVAGLIDPRSGQPAAGVTAAWVLADTGEKARVWANALALLGPEEGLALLAAQPGVEGAVLFGKDGAPAWKASAGFPLQQPHGLKRAR